MASPLPNNSVAGLQTYSKFWYTDNSMANIDEIQLIAATDDVVYDAGCVIVQITSGSDAGKYVNYNPAGLVPGQNTITPGKAGIISDQYLTSDVSTSGGVANMVWGNAQIFASAIYWTEPGADDPADVIGLTTGKIPGEVYGRSETVVRLF